MEFNATKYNTHWDDFTLDELGTFNRGKSKHRPRDDEILFKDGKYPLIQTGDVKKASIYINNHDICYSEYGLSQSKIWPKGTLCITIAANIAETAILNYPMCFPDSVVGFNAFNDKTSEILMHYIFTYIRKSIQRSASGSIQDNINIDYLKKLKFKIPKKHQQQKIASVLSALDAKIDLNNKINAELEAMAKTLYDYWFVQFEFPNEDGKPYKSSGGKMTYNPELKREIPDGWAVKSLGDICFIKKGTLITEKEADHNGQIKVVSAGISFSYHHSKYNYPENTITISASGANAGFINFWHEPIFACDCTVVRGRDTMHTLSILHYLMLRQDYIYSQARGSAQPHVYPKDIETIKTEVIPENILKLFGKLIPQCNQKIAINKKQNQKLAEIRDFLLPLLMNGQVGVA